jgi:hypothetical protein
MLNDKGLRAFLEGALRLPDGGSEGLTAEKTCQQPFPVSLCELACLIV